MEVDAIQQRPGNPVAIAADGGPGTGAASRSITVEPARTGVHCSDQGEAAGIGHRLTGARDRNGFVLQWLPQGFEHVPAELRKLVEKENPLMREADFAGSRHAAAADQPRVADGVVRGTERAARHKRLSGGQASGHGMHLRRLHRLLQLEGREDSRQAPREHGLARSRRPGQQQIVPSRGRHHERALGMGLTPDVGQVRRVPGATAQKSDAVHGDRADRVAPGQMADHFRQARRPDHLHRPRHRRLARV